MIPGSRNNPATPGMHTSEEMPRVYRRVKDIREPSLSITSHHIVLEVDEDEECKESMRRTEVPEDKLTRDVLIYELNAAVHLLATGDVATTICQLNLLYDKNLKNEFVQNVLYLNSGVSVIINLLELEHIQCNIGALRIIEKMASNNKMRIIFANLGVIPLLVYHMMKAELDMKILLAKALSQLCQVRRCARHFRKQGGIPLLIDCLDVEESTLYTNTSLLTKLQEDHIVLATAAATTLKKLAMYPKTINIMYESGLILCVKNIANCCHKVLLMETFGLLAHCAECSKIRQDIEREGMLLPLLQNITDGDSKMREACAATIGHCAGDSDLTCHIVRMLGGLKDIVALTKNVKEDKSTLTAVIFAAAKLAQDDRNLKIMSDKGLVYHLLKCFYVGLLERDLISNVLEGLAECARLEVNRDAIGNSDVIPIVVGKLMEDDARLLMATSMFLGTCARSEGLAQKITAYDGMRLLFSVMVLENAGATATSLWALRPLIRNTVDSAEEVRCLVGGFTLLLKQLTSSDPHVTARACNLVAEICKDPENLQILSDWGLVRLLASRTSDPNEEVRFSLAEAIAYASSLRENAKEFGRCGVVPMVKDFLSTRNVMMHMYAMEALSKLTEVPFNCIVLHECGGVTPVLLDLAAPYDELQRLATIVLRNMRLVPLTAEKNAVEGCRLDCLANLGSKTKKVSLTRLSKYRKQNQAYK